MRVLECCRILAVMIVVLAAASSAVALERVVNTPYNGAGTASAELRLPSCTSGQVLTSLGSNTFTCIDVNSTLQTNLNAGDVANGGSNTTNDGIGLPNCGPEQALGVSGGKFVCANIVKNAPKCENGFALVGDGQQTLSCVQATAPVSCGAGQALTSDQGQFKCVTLKTPPTCGMGQALTASGGEFSCMSFTATNCNGRITQNWGGYQYCSTLTCPTGQSLTASDGYLQCSVVAKTNIMAVVEETKKYGSYINSPQESSSCPPGWNYIPVFRNLPSTGLKATGSHLAIPGETTVKNTSTCGPKDTTACDSVSDVKTTASTGAGYYLCIQ